ncbi:hypothetical protein V5P93_001125 [Actinokineospora auranticolor]|uniref:Uncharacterized protein n=1 Tax=Actinokineospora auranticolor TaxID=155976 RepID=A0A2S6GB59_9PSEU|nr:hypothetical protein [Actinokineospora auranticolor]PPK60828.1 hypothetical protein CLV40_14713 [Actinokineospora auranticolor]
MNAQFETPMYAFKPEGSPQMLLYENLARARTREAEQTARTHRLVRRLSAAKRWERVSRWAARRADRVAADL